MHRQSNPALSHLTAHVRARAASSSAKVSPLGKWARQPALSDTVFKPAAASSSRSPSHSVPSDTPPAPASKWARKESESGSLWGSRPSSNFRSRTPEHATRPPARHHDIRHPSSNRPTKTSQLANKKKGIATPQASSSRDAVFDRESTSHPNKRSKDKKEQSKEGLVPTMDRGTPGEGSEIRNTERDVEEDELAEDRSSFSPRSDSVFDSDGNRNRKRGNLVFKQRGSLLSSHAAPANHDRGQEVTTDQKPKRLPKAKVMRLKVDLHIPSMVSVETLSRLLNITLSRLQRKMREQGMEDQMSPDYILTTEYAALLAEEFGRNAIVDDEAAFDLYPPPTATDLSTLHPRPPVVTIMGHVDHGKTTLLDTLRSASVAAGEAGGITQHIGAFSVKVPNASGSGPSVITFLDTPGHAAFSAMRARGARVTDIVVLVVAADDGVMPQTKEVIELVKKDDKVQLVVAINKTDKPGIDLDKVHNALLVEEIHVEPIGGDIPAVRVSGLTGQGLDELVETISAVSELQDLRAERDGLVHGYVLESKVQKGFGAVATVLVLRGCLKPGANIIAGTSTGRVRMMTDSTGKVVKAAYPGDAITVSGWKELPAAGDEVLQGSDRDIKRAVANRHRKADLEKMLQDVEVINEQRTKDRELRVAELLAEEKGEEIPRQEEEKGPKEVNILIKGDVSGSVEALTEVLQNIGNEVARAKVLDGEVGEVTSSDVLRAKTASAMIVAFSMPVPKSVQAEAASVGVTIYSSSVIYKVMDEVRARVTDLLPQQYAKKVTGEATVYQIFDIQLARKRGKKVAGCRITNGLVERNKQVQVVRNGEVVFEGRMDTFKHRKDDINEARKGSECGIAVEKFEDLQADDIIQAYNLEPLPKFL